MKPVIQIDQTRTPDGGSLILYRHDRDFIMMVDRHELMNSRRHESELELARLGCARLAEHRNPVVLIGGLGMGYTARAALDTVGEGARVVVAELLPDVVRWNRQWLGGLAGHPLRDPRLELQVRDLVDVIADEPAGFDAILLDVDNGPDAFTDAANQQLYTPRGIELLLGGLRRKGVLGVWSSGVDPRFEKRLGKAGLEVRRIRVRPYPTAKSRSHCVWLASRDPRSLPPKPVRDPD